MFVWYRRAENLGIGFGNLTYSETEGRFYAADGSLMPLTPMQQQLMEMFFHSPSHSLSKTDICEALWPKKPDASDTLYTLIRRLKPVIEQHSNLKIESDRSKAYRLTMK
jgi:DNA-binding response OmpR family regulator